MRGLFLICAAFSSCASPPPASPGAPSSAGSGKAHAAFELVFEPVDAAWARDLDPLLLTAVAEVERSFGQPFLEPFEVVILADRAAFDASFPPEWGLGKTECWMVAAGVADSLRLLSPRVWKSEACEHDPADALHVQNLLADETVHVYHGQRNPSPDFTGVVGIDWFVEGLATYASGQLESGELAPAREAIESGKGPAALGQAWSGKYRYGVAGSLVAFLDHRLGRARLFDLLAATSQEELLALIGMDEQELLASWRESVLGP